MDYAIIRSGQTKLLEVIQLSAWSDYEWDDFATVKDFNTDEIVWFFEEKDAVIFMLENFPEKMINNKYFSDYSYDKNYYIG